MTSMRIWLSLPYCKFTSTRTMPVLPFFKAGHRLADDGAVRATGVARFHRVSGHIGCGEQVAGFDGFLRGVGVDPHTPAYGNRRVVLAALKVAQDDAFGQPVRARHDARDALVVRAPRFAQMSRVIGVDLHDGAGLQRFGGGELLGEVRACDFQHFHAGSAVHIQFRGR
jgi:hypothetical protein